MADVASEQLPETLRFRPDLVLISAGDNDVTHLTKSGRVMTDLRRITEELRKANPRVEILVTGAPQMGSIPRFAWPLSALARARTASLNRHFDETAHDLDLIHIRIAERIGPAFDARPELFADDRFHPNVEGYDVWQRAITPRLDEALTKESVPKK